MKFLRNLSITRKFTLVILGTCLLAVAVAGIGLGVYERSAFQSALTSELLALADILGTNTAAALAFHDQKSATDVLGALKAEHNIVAAGLYDNDGKVFASYLRSGDKKEDNLPRSIQRSSSRKVTQHGADVRLPAERSHPDYSRAIARAAFRPIASKTLADASVGHACEGISELQSGHKPDPALRRSIRLAPGWSAQKVMAHCHSGQISPHPCCFCLLWKQECRGAT